MHESIETSVGKNCPNDRQDVSIIQFLLNSAREHGGIPKQRLKVDGILGPKTLGAIEEFQKKYCKIADGRVDPHGETLTRLNHLAGHFIALNDGKSYLDPKLPPPKLV